MGEYGLTPNGVNIKRLDVILDEMHAKLSERLGVNTRQNRQSLLNHMLTNIGDQIAELWEFGGEVYFSQYPSTAEGSSLDNAVQLGGITRELPEKSYYPILCMGLDGTTVPEGTLIATDTNPAINLVLKSSANISRESFNKAVVVLAAEDVTGVLNIVLNGIIYSADELEGFTELIDSEKFSVRYEDGKLYLDSVDEVGSNTMVLSENLTTETVGSIITFATEEDGDIYIPNGVITRIVRTVAGLESITNVGTYLAGRHTETDSELRQSFLDKIYNRSSNMLESIRSAILKNNPSVNTVVAYENDTNDYDANGRPPHSIEIVVDGGNPTEIAEQILKTKAGGISTFGEVEIPLRGVFGEEIIVRFNRPTRKFIWFEVGVTLSSNVTPPLDYAERIKDTIIECMSGIGAGSDIVPQKFVGRLYENVSGIDYFDIRIHSTTNEQEVPQSYDERSVSVGIRERAVTSKTRIGVVIDD